MDSTVRPDGPAAEPGSNGGSSSSTRIVILGCGSSTGTPQARCVTRGALGECPACTDAFTNGAASRNKRGNPSMLIQHNGKNIVVDVGKSFREGIFRALKAGIVIDRIDAVLLTHAHADAMLGLDDLREWVWDTGFSIPVYLRQEDLRIVQNVFPYLVDRTKATGSGHVASLDFVTFAGDCESLQIHGLDFVPLPVDHGIRSTALGYMFGNVAYLSDLNHIPESTWTRIEAAGPIDVAIVDSTFIEREIASHYSMVQALEMCASRLHPRKVYLTGMSHEFEYTTLNPLLQRNRQTQQQGGDSLEIRLPQSGKMYRLPNVDAEMAYDTLVIELAS